MTAAALGRPWRVVPCLARGLAILSIAAAVLAATLAAPAHAAVDDLIISELLADNDRGLLDGDGDRPDWIELYNSGSGSLSLAGYSLSDDPTEPTKWTFPEVELAAGGYLIVFASGKYRLTPTELHTNFKLSKDGDALYLYAPDSTLLSSVVFDAQTADRSIGPAAGGGTVSFASPTPGRANATGALTAPAKPGFSMPRGVYTQGLVVSLTSPEAGTVIRYTTNGTEPTTASPIAPAAFNVVSTTTLRARAWNAAGASATATSTYVITGDIIAAPYMNRSIAQGGQYGHRMTDSLLSVPSVSLVTPTSIVEADYRQVSMEWLDPSTGDHFQIDAGAKLYGNTSLQDPKNHMRLKFSTEFGPAKLDFPIFDGFAVGADHGIVPATSFDQLQLRQGAGDSQFRDVSHGIHMRNALADDTMLEMGIPNPHNRFVHVYLNGEYRGVYQLRERFDADFMASYHGGVDDDYAAVHRGTAFDGPDWPWAQIANDRRYVAVADKVDIDALADLAVYQWWNGTTDWYHNWNWMGAGPIDHASPIGWIFHNNDHDWGLGRTGLRQNSLSVDGPGYLLSSLNSERHPDWLDAVSRSITRNLYGDGPLTPSTGRQRLDRRAAEIERALVAETARWTRSGWDVDGEWQTRIAWLRNTWFPQRTAIVLGQLGTTFRTVDEPVLAPCCQVTAGSSVQLRTGGGGTATIIYTTDDTDPRLAGGGVAPGATWVDGVAGVDITVDRPMVVTARVLRNQSWSSSQRWDLRVAGYETPVVLNEWNAVSRTSLAEADDPVLGRPGGNGGDWFELVVVADHADLRGYRYEIAEGAVPGTTVEFTQDPLWSDLRAGTIITVAEDLAEDVSYDPARGDWHINVTARAGGSGRYVSATNFAVSAADWRVTIRNAAGGAVFGPAGEGIGGLTGVTETEVGELEATPSPTTAVGDYGDSNGSTFGLPNVYEGTVQDLSGLRSSVSRFPDVDRSGEVDDADVMAVLEMVVDPSLADQPGDVDADGTVALGDAHLLARCLHDASAVACAQLVLD